MTRALFWISLLTCTVVGMMHSIIGLSSFEPLSPNYVWFLGAGLVFFLTAGFNVAAWRAARSDRLVRRLVHAANFLMTGFGLLAVRGAEGLRSWLAFAAAIGLLVAQLAADRSPERTPAAMPEHDADRAAADRTRAGDTG